MIQRTIPMKVLKQTRLLYETHTNNPDMQEKTQYRHEHEKAGEEKHSNDHCVTSSAVIAAFSTPPAVPSDRRFLRTFSIKASPAL